MDLDLIKRIKKVNERNYKLRERERKLMNLMEEKNHNKKIDKLLKGYDILGFINDEYKNRETPMTQAEFVQKMREIEEKYKVNQQMPSIKSSQDSYLQDLEKYISEFILLSGIRWNSAIQYKKLWSKERNEKRLEEINLEKEYEKLLKLQDTENIDIKSKISTLIKRHYELIEFQEKKLYGEEKQQDELESLFTVRERIFKLAQNIFML